MRVSGPLRLLVLTGVILTAACGTDGESFRPVARVAEPYHAYVSELFLDGPKDICIVTQFTSNMDEFANITTDNHQSYAWMHGYKAFAYRGRISGGEFVDAQHPERLRRDGLYWQKLAAIKRAMGRRSEAGGTPACGWVMWLDADAIFTNIYRPIENVLEAYAGNDVVLPREHMDTLINAGVFFVKNSEIGRAFVDDVSAMYSAYKDRKLPEQQAMQDYAFGVSVPTPYPGLFDALQPRLRGGVAVAPQRDFGSFAIAGAPFDPISSWEPCDFVAHIAGTRADIRASMMRSMTGSLGECALEPGTQINP